MLRLFAELAILVVRVEWFVLTKAAWLAPPPIVPGAWGLEFPGGGGVEGAVESMLDI